MQYYGWELMTVTIDSGASETVCGSMHFNNTDITESEGSRRGVKYSAANGEAIANLGQKTINFLTEEGSCRNMTSRVCEVTKPLASVSRICKKGHRVVFEDGNKYIENLLTGELTRMREQNGVYLLDLWIPPHEGFMRPGF